MSINSQSNCRKMKREFTLRPRISRLYEVKVHLFGALAHDNTASLIILQRAVGMAHHLQHIIDGIVHVPGDRRARRQRF